MPKFGHTLMMQRRNEANYNKRKENAPKGFDISLADAISEYNLDTDQIRILGELTTQRRSGLAHATVGGTVWYRRRQLCEMLGIVGV